MGGAVARVPVDETAFPHRDAQFFVNIIGATDEAARADEMRQNVRALYGKLSRAAMPGIQSNFSDQDDGEDSRRFGREHAARLESLRRRYDPAGTLVGR